MTTSMTFCLGQNARQMAKDAMPGAHKLSKHGKRLKYVINLYC